jgi:hypothetical protein
MPEGAASPGELGAALGLNGARQAETVRAMRDAGYVTGPKGQVRLTTAGWARFGVEQGEHVGAGKVLDQALEGWPQTHRAFAELLVSAVVARHHLRDTYPSQHLAFLALGETGTGKSATARLVCDLFGWDYVEHELMAHAQTAGSLLGRRVQTAEGWTWEKAEVTRLPFLFLDELDKASPEVQRTALVYAQGEIRTNAEGQLHELLPTAMLAANPPGNGGDRYAVLRPEYRRRSVVLDTSSMRGRSDEWERLLRPYYADQRRPRLRLEQLMPPAGELPAQSRAFLEQVRGVLTDAGREEFPGVVALELAALGRWALLGADADPNLAAAVTAFGYLQVAETVPGQVQPGWQPDWATIRAALGDGAGTELLRAALERSRNERDQTQQAVRRARTQHTAESLHVTEQGEMLAARLERVREAIDGRRLPAATTSEERDQAQGLRTTLRTLQGRASRVGTPAALQEVQDLAADPLARAEQLAAGVHQRQQQAEAEETARKQAASEERMRQQQAADEAKRQRVEHARIQRQNQTQWRKQQEDTLLGVVSQAKTLEQFYRRKHTQPGESPLETLSEYEVNGYRILTWAPSAGGGAAGLASILGAAAAAFAGQEPPVASTGRWRVAGTSLAFPGTRNHCPALSQWGAETRQVLRPFLEFLHEKEDDMRGALGKAARSGRPALRAEPARPGLPRATGGYRLQPAERQGGAHGR